MFCKFANINTGLKLSLQHQECKHLYLFILPENRPFYKAREVLRNIHFHHPL